MKQAIIILVKSKKIQKVKAKYNPKLKFIKPHITLAFPFSNINQDELEKHIKKVISRTKSFNIVLNGVKKSPKEYYLYLLVKQGKQQIIEIHKNLYSKLITKFIIKDILYIPHVTLGVFKTKKEIDKAFNEVKKLNLKFKFNINSIELITLNRNLSVKKSKSFNLK